MKKILLLLLFIPIMIYAKNSTPNKLFEYRLQQIENKYSTLQKQNDTLQEQKYILDNKIKILEQQTTQQKLDIEKKNNENEKSYKLVIEESNNLYYNQLITFQVILGLIGLSLGLLVFIGYKNIKNKINKIVNKQILKESKQAIEDLNEKLNMLQIKINEMDTALELSIEKDSSKQTKNDKDIIRFLAKKSIEKKEKNTDDWFVIGLDYQQQKQAEKAMEAYEKATTLDPKNANAFHNWGVVITELAKIKNDEILYKQSIEKFEKASTLDPKNANALNGWGVAILELAKIKKDEALCKQSIEKFEKASTLDPKNANALNGWGVGILELAKNKNDEILYKQSIEKFEKATILDPKNANPFNGWGVAILELAKIKNDEILYKQSIEKFEKASTLDPKNANPLNGWGVAILELAKIKNDEALYEQSFEKFEKATILDPKNANTFNSWGSALIELAKIKNDEALYEKGFEKYNEAYKLNGNMYNISCYYALKKDKTNALKYLEKSLENKNITVEHVEKDEDWKEYRDNHNFIELMDKYRLK